MKPSALCVQGAACVSSRSSAEEGKAAVGRCRCQAMCSPPRIVCVEASGSGPRWGWRAQEEKTRVPKQLWDSRGLLLFKS